LDLKAFVKVYDGSTGFLLACQSQLLNS